MNKNIACPQFQFFEGQVSICKFYNQNNNWNKYIIGKDNHIVLVLWLKTNKRNPLPLQNTPR